MATLTPLSKAIISIAVIGAVISAVWHLGLKDLIAGGNTSAPTTAASTTTVTLASVAARLLTPAPAPQAPALPASNTGMPSPPASAPVKVGNLSGSPGENAEAGRILLESKDYAKARIYLEAAVQGGDGGAACHLGEMTLHGQGGIAANRDNAAKLFQLAQARNIICFTTAN